MKDRDYFLTFAKEKLVRFYFYEHLGFVYQATNDSPVLMTIVCKWKMKNFVFGGGQYGFI
jgi:hypothetical protein